MNLGLAQIDITPPVGIELGGYAARVQPSISVMDRLHLRALYLKDETEKLLWLHADVIALDTEFVTSFRAWAKANLNVREEQVLLTATHTHAGPVTVALTGCGNMDETYLRQLRANFESAARQAMAKTEPVRVVYATGECRLAIDRRNKPSAHTDPVVSAIGFKRADNTFAAVIANYAMHPTSLGSVNRAISTDWCGYAADLLSQNLPGNPITLVTNGACGNINPPKQNIDHATLRGFGQTVAQTVLDKLAAAPADDARLNLAREVVAMPMDTMTPEEIDRVIDHNLTQNVGESWAVPWRIANEAWRETQKQLVQSGRGQTLDIELFTARIGPVTIIAINGEIFSRFTEILRRRTGQNLFTITYANCAFGYIPTREAYAEGGYEVEQAHFFYNTFRPKSGGLELLADRAAQLVEKLNH